MGEADAATACVSSIISLIISIPMICVGNAYWDWCKVGASAYLFHSGILGLVVAIVNTIFAVGAYVCNFCRPDGKTKFALTVSIGIAEIIRMIWGFVIVFPAYASWDYKNGHYSCCYNYTGPPVMPYTVDLELSPDYYCEYTPFMFAFVLVLLEAILISLGAFCGCCAGAIMFFKS